MKIGRGLCNELFKKKLGFLDEYPLPEVVEANTWFESKGGLIYKERAAYTFRFTGSSLLLFLRMIP